MKSGVLSLITLLLCCPVAFADWTLDNDASELTFISIKAGDFAEVHRFTELSGSVDDDGAATVTVQLASVDTLIPIRDERMRDVLFNTGAFPTATLSTEVDADFVELAPGARRMADARITVDLHGATSTLTAPLMVARLDEATVLVSSLKPVIVNAGAFELVDGIEQLREIAGLPSISKAVPVSFVLTFKKAR